MRPEPMRFLAAILALTLSLLAAVAPAGALAGAPAVWLDDVSLGTIAIERSGKPPLIPLTPLARALDWKMTRLSRTVILRGQDRIVSVTIGARTIGENGDLRAMFAEAPIDRGGQLYLNARDAARLFGLSFSQNGKLAFHRPVDLSTNTQIVEVAATPTPHPIATPRMSRRQDNGGFGSSANAGRVLLSLDRVGTSNVLHLESETQGSYLMTRLDSSGNDQLGTPNATVVVGDAHRNASIGYISDPLAGLIFGGGVYEGIDLHSGSIGRDAFIGRRLDTGFTSFGAVLSNPHGGVSDTIDVLTRGTSYAETILRRFEVDHEAWGDYSREFILGDRGFGVGFGARTRGRTFLESAVTYASPGLPLGPNDAPIRIDAGRELSPATTVVAGFSATPQSPLGPFVGFTTHMQNLIAG
ncbi:MAG: hypothetical protein JO349_02960, partial [Candidatus Eremiobacteraeota bacterium]|nr:hypothetical protein [Candidatus Eremiobacteraeota bacterium]